MFDNDKYCNKGYTIYLEKKIEDKKNIFPSSILEVKIIKYYKILKSFDEYKINDVVVLINNSKVHYKYINKYLELNKVSTKEFQDLNSKIYDINYRAIPYNFFENKQHIQLYILEKDNDNYYLIFDYDNRKYKDKNLKEFLKCDRKNIDKFLE